MKKIRWYAASSLFMAFLIWMGQIPSQAQQIRSGAMTVLFTNQTLTSSYVSSSASLDLQSYDSAYITVSIVKTNINDMAKIKPQWSHDDSAYFDEPVLAQATNVNGEVIYGVSSTVILLPMWGTTNAYIERSRRLARFFRFSVSSTNTSTTATLSISGTKANNQN